ncbi:MAG: DUF4314 domain-containing protein [Candidatus Thermoplasmatota archaeon]
MKEISKEDIKVGDRIELKDIEDNLTKLKKGDKGTVFKIDEEQDLIWVEWDNGEKLALIKGVDKYKKVKNNG